METNALLNVQPIKTFSQTSNWIVNFVLKMQHIYERANQKLGWIGGFLAALLGVLSIRLVLKVAKSVVSNSTQRLENEFLTNTTLQFTSENKETFQTIHEKLGSDIETLSQLPQQSQRNPFLLNGVARQIHEIADLLKNYRRVLSTQL